MKWNGFFFFVFCMCLNMLKRTCTAVYASDETLRSYSDAETKKIDENDQGNLGETRQRYQLCPRPLESRGKGGGRARERTTATDTAGRSGTASDSLQNPGGFTAHAASRDQNSGVK